MQKFRGVPVVTPQEDEAAFGEMDVLGTGLVDVHELAEALRVMGHLLNRIFTTSTCLWSVRELLCRKCERHEFADRSYRCVGTVHSVLGTAEVAASSSTKRPQKVSSQGRRTSRLS